MLVKVCQDTGSASACLQAAPELAERNFGNLDFTSDKNYGDVWLEDTHSATFRPSGQNLAKVTRLVHDLAYGRRMGPTCQWPAKSFERMQTMQVHAGRWHQPLGSRSAPNGCARG